MADEPDYAPRPAWEAEWDRDPDDPDDDGPTEAVGELVAALSDEDPVVAEAAAWALGCMAPQ